MKNENIKNLEAELNKIEKTGTTDFIKFSGIIDELKALDPEIAKELLAQYPVFAGMIKETFSKYVDVINKIVVENGRSMDSFYSTLGKELNSADYDTKYMYELALKAMETQQKILDNPNISETVLIQALSNQTEVIKMYMEFVKGKQEKENDIRNRAYQKDSENKEWGLKVLGVCGYIFLGALSIGSIILFKGAGPKIPIIPPKTF